VRRECEAYSLACANPDMGNLCFADADEAAAIEELGLIMQCVSFTIVCCVG
jgi:hypothetical protein